MNLTQLSTLKARLNIDRGDTADDALLTNALTGLSQRFAGECNRQFDYQDDATFTFRANEMDIRVDRYPIASVTGFALKDSGTTGWHVVTGADVPDFVIGPQQNIIELASPLGDSAQIAQVTYSGGYILPGDSNSDGSIALPSDLEQAAVEQLAYWYQRRNQLGLVSISGDGGSISQFRALDLLPNVQAVLRQYERLVL